MAAFAISCSNDATDEPQTPNKPTEQPKMVTVSFAMKGDVTVEEAPLSRTAGEETESRDLYGISVYYNKELDNKINDPYGYGLFDNIGDMTISLLTGYKYKFVCSLIKDGKDKLGQYGIPYSYSTGGSFVSKNIGYCMPFCKSKMPYLENSFDYTTIISCDRECDIRYPAIYFYDWQTAATSVGNQFILGDGYHLTGLGQGYSHEQGLTTADFKMDRGHNFDYSNSHIHKYSGEANYTKCPATDRYYGELTDYSPKTDGVVTIEMKRCVFGVKVNVTGITDGTFTISSDFYNYSTTENVNSEETIYTFENVYDCWQNAISTNDYSQDILLKMKWQRGNGVTQTLDPLTVTFKRNVLTTVNIRLNGGDTNNSFNLDIEKDEMGEENTDFDIDAGDMTDTPVDPTE